jgi:DNA-binding CsgD family transcriptional regulator
VVPESRIAENSQKRQITAVFEAAHDLIHAALVTQFRFDETTAAEFENDLYVWFCRFSIRSGSRSPHELGSVLLAASWQFARICQHHVRAVKNETRVSSKPARRPTKRIRNSASASLRRRRGKHTVASGSELTERELEIVQGMSRGLGKREIGRRLELSEETVETCVEAIVRKLQADSRSGDDLYAWERTGSSS